MKISVADIGDGLCVVPHTVSNTLILRHLGFNAPSPILWQYDWRGGTPFKVQRVTCDLLTSARRAYVFNDMGTGKTKAALWAWDFLKTANIANKALVVCPISTMNFVWARETFATLPARKAVVLYGSKAERLELLNKDADLYIINHDGVKVIYEALAARTDIDTLILDELAVYRNNSDRSKLMRKLVNDEKGPPDRFAWVWGMTGEPMPNYPTDVWMQARIITPKSVPEYFKQARETLMYNVNQFKWLPKQNAVATAFSWMQPQVRFDLDDVVELPDLIPRPPIDIPLSTKQQRAYDKIVSEFRVMVDEKVITAVNAGACMMKLLQIACGWVYATGHETVCLDPEPRLETLVDLINASPHKVIVFSPFRHTVEGISARLARKDINIEHTTIHGDTPQSVRDQEFNLFQNTAKYKVLNAHPQCIAHGLTLTAASTIIWYGPITSLETYDQANARVRRVGQKHKQQIIHLQSTGVEKKIYALLKAKQKVQDQLLSMFEDATERRVIR